MKPSKNLYFCPQNLYQDTFRIQNPYRRKGYEFIMYFI